MTPSCSSISRPPRKKKDLKSKSVNKEKASKVEKTEKAKPKERTPRLATSWYLSPQKYGAALQRQHFLLGPTWRKGGAVLLETFGNVLSSARPLQEGC